MIQITFSQYHWNPPKICTCWRCNKENNVTSTFLTEFKATLHSRVESVIMPQEMYFKWKGLEYTCKDALNDIQTLRMYLDVLEEKLRQTKEILPDFLTKEDGNIK